LQVYPEDCYCINSEYYVAREREDEREEMYQKTQTKQNKVMTKIQNIIFGNSVLLFPKAHVVFAL